MLPASSLSFAARRLFGGFVACLAVLALGGGCGGAVTDDCQTLTYPECSATPHCASVYRYDVTLNGSGTGVCVMSCDVDGECPERTVPVSAVGWQPIIEGMISACACFPESWNGGGYPARMVGPRRAR